MKKNMYCKNIKRHSNLLASLSNACISSPLPRSNVVPAVEPTGPLHITLINKVLPQFSVNCGNGTSIICSSTHCTHSCGTDQPHHLDGLVQKLRHTHNLLGGALLHSLMRPTSPARFCFALGTRQIEPLVRSLNLQVTPTLLARTTLLFHPWQETVFV